MVGFSWPCGCCDNCNPKGFVIGGLSQYSLGGSPPQYKVWHPISQYDFDTATWCQAVSSGAGYYNGGACDGSLVYFCGGVHLGGSSNVVPYYQVGYYDPQSSSLTISDAVLSYTGGRGTMHDRSTKMLITISGPDPAPEFNNLQTVEKYTFATDIIVAAPTANSSDQRRIYASLTQGSEYGYVLGGAMYDEYDVHDSYLPNIDKTDFSSDTTSAAGSIEYPRRHFGSMSAGGEFGYIAGGYEREMVGQHDRTNTIEKVAYPSGSSSLIGAVLHSDMSQGTGFSNWDDKGYFLGGMSPDGVVSSVGISYQGEMDLATDTISMADTTNSPIAQSTAAGVSNA